MNQTMKLKNLRCQHCLFHLKNLQSSFSKWNLVRSTVRSGAKVHSSILNRNYSKNRTVESWVLPCSPPPVLGDSTVIHSARKQPFPSKLLNEPHTFPCSNHTQAKCTKTTPREGSIHHGQEFYRHRQEGSWGEAGLRFSSRKELAVGLPFQQEHKKWVSEWTGDTCTLLQTRTDIKQATGGKRLLKVS